ncbi:hypothetical protein MPTK1_5g18330 [Marchantia polymorpha subsp. ruderalis]|uniref:Uncharacterized protein n=2 Tax=Marchantia polymorpha TaxID=3197 RepID=A0A176WHQ5_MARPO|nr:hypothetical protein AXG93_374s1050 [Marchantia polymorpha subsp. ruderalis]PTQ34019.1 hypothetical protein MARPO_0084s0081 [Marchantia polymorpha]BBN12231.1 hypothetical protein Mp_5g18330 [Marchantia polymorpha subsp. ruderalis]|eukprot:PTQ34019.1 hypothetical protein MARPO_0084s0081 [Marchantia polymorpha]
MGIQGDEKRKGEGSRGGGGAAKRGGGGGGGGRGAAKGHRPKKSETNFIPAYTGELAPPPVARDIMAVPAKLRRIMNLRAVVASGEKYDPNAYKRKSKQDESKASKKKDKKRKLSDEKTGTNGAQSKDEDGTPAAKKSKLSRAEEELKRLNAKFDRKARVKPKSTGETWKSYLNEKKKKKRGPKAAEEGLLAMNVHEKIEFGDVVQAPPKLTFPKKAAAIKEKERVDGDQSALHERLRMQAIESYRQRKNWSERPGQQLPNLDLAIAVPEL